MGMEELASVRMGEIPPFARTAADATEPVRAPPREHGQRLAATYEHAGIGISEVDAEGRLQRVNADLAALLRYPADELIGRSVFELTVPEDVAADHAQFQLQVRGELDRYSVEKRFRRADGG